MSVRLDRRRALALAAAGASAPAWLRAEPEPGQRVSGETAPPREASWYTRLPEGRVECGLCPRKCQVADAERGSCGVRENRGGTYHTLVWGAACALHVDPVEKKPLFHVLPGRSALSFAAAGCNVECRFCQNWEISQFRPEQVPFVWLPPEALAEAARRAGAPLIAATYSEPVVFWEYVRDTARKAREAGVRTVAITNGYIRRAPLAEVLPLLAAVKVDLKAFRQEFYTELVRGELEPVLEVLQQIRAAGTWLEIVVLLIPGRNDSEAEVRDLSRWVKANLGPDVPVHFTRFHPTYRLTDLPPTPVASVERAWQVARAEGLRFAYVGNLPGHPGESTTCPGCSGMLIRRVGFKIVDNRLAAGRCPDCGREIPGVWS